MATAPKLKEARTEMNQMESPSRLRRARVLAGTALGGVVLCITAGTPALAVDHPGSPGHGGGECTPGLVEGTSTPVYAHVEKAHLERSPAQQVSDIQATDDYVLLHTVWAESFTAPTRYGATYIAQETPRPVFGHVQKAHLERSPGQQVGDVRATDDYVLLHTVWAESIAQPTVDVINGHGC